MKWKLIFEESPGCCFVCVHGSFVFILEHAFKWGRVFEKSVSHNFTSINHACVRMLYARTHASNGPGSSSLFIGPYIRLNRAGYEEK